ERTLERGGPPKGGPLALRGLYTRGGGEIYPRGEMLRTLAIAGALALLTAATASAAGNATASLTSPTAAQHSGLTLVLRPAVLRCGRLGARALTITLPQAMRVPASIPRDAVRVGGRAVAAVRTDGKTVVLSLPSPHGVSCHSIVVGSLRVE